MSDIAKEARSRTSLDGWMNVRERLVYGWLVDLEDKTSKRLVNIFVNGQSVGLARADRYHEGAHGKHGGDGLYRFSLYYDRPLEEGGLEVVAQDAQTGTPLRVKGPQSVTEGKRSGRPLTVELVRFGAKIELFGTIGAYPGNVVELELWQGQERPEPAIPPTQLEKRYKFTAEVPGELMPHLLSGESELALPGMKEGGIALPLADLVFASVAHRDGVLTVELSGNMEVDPGVPLTARFLRPHLPPTDLPLGSFCNKAAVMVPDGVQFSEESFEVLLGNAPLRMRFQHELLRDLDFSTLGNAGSPWSLSEGATGERGFFAFPRALSDQLNLGGDIARISNSSGSGSVRLGQALGARNKPVIVAARASSGTLLAARLTDQTGTLCEESTTVDDNSWRVFKLEHGPQREAAGELLFEIEASGEQVAMLEVAFADSRQAAVPGERQTANLLANPNLELWPEGVGRRRQLLQGEIASGWRFSNVDCADPVWTAAVQHPDSGSFGLAIAAPEVPKCLTLEADFQSAAITQKMLIRFRAGVTAAARQLLGDVTRHVPQFAQIEHIAIVRRTVANPEETSEPTDEIIGKVPRNIAIGAEATSFQLPITVDLQRKGDGEIAGSVVTHHLIFEFERPTVAALFDVEVVPQSDGWAEPAGPELRLEDRVIELQISKLSGLEAWLSKTAANSALQKRHRPPLKWSVDESREPVEIVIPVFNAVEETLACLNSLATSTRVPILVRVVDDGSDEPVRAALEDYARDKPWVELHLLSRNHGYTYAADFGLRLTQSEWVVLLNSDTIVTQGWLEGLLACARSDARIALAGPLSNAASFQSVPELYSAEGKWKVNTLPRSLTADDMADLVRSASMRAYPEVPLLNGFCTLIRRSAFLELGGLNTAAFPVGYGEENDLCLRASKAGYKLAVADDVYVYHVKSASFGNARRDELSKKGNAALRALHPDVDIGALTKRFRDTLPLVAVRERLGRELARIESDPQSTNLRGAAEEPASEKPLSRETQKA